MHGIAALWFTDTENVRRLLFLLVLELVQRACEQVQCLLCKCGMDRRDSWVQTLRVDVRESFDITDVALLVLLVNFHLLLLVGNRGESRLTEWHCALLILMLLTLTSLENVIIRACDRVLLFLLLWTWEYRKHVFGWEVWRVEFVGEFL